jgi:hypothetical protein
MSAVCRKPSHLANPIHPVQQVSSSACIRVHPRFQLSGRERLTAAGFRRTMLPVNKQERQYAFLWAAVIMLGSCLPYLAVWWYTPLDGLFPGLLFNSDDHGVYFAWMRQAADGQLLFRNLFDPGPQRGVYVHLYFLLLGQFARLPGIDIPLAYHLGRVLFGVVTLVLVYRLAAFVTSDLFARRCVFWVTALSGGLGWLFWTHQPRYTEPADVWQPEALTFPSLYANGLFAVSLALMLGVVICLLLAEERGRRWAAAAGACGLLLGNVHSYDVIHLTVVWSAFLVGRWIAERRFPARAFGMALLAAAVTAPSVAYMAWFYLAEPTFRARADVATLSPDPLMYVWGYGLLLPLAAWGGVLLRREGRENEGSDHREALVALAAVAAAAVLMVAAYRLARGSLWSLVPLVPLAAWLALAFFTRATRRDAGTEGRSDAGTQGRREAGTQRHSDAGTEGQSAIRNPQSAIGAIRNPQSEQSGQSKIQNPKSKIVLVWSVTGIAAAYLPFAFQRKMIMGWHLPVALLAGLAVAELARRAAGRLPLPRASALWAGIAAGLLTALLSVTSVRYMERDLAVAFGRGTTSTGIHPVYWPADRIRAFEWLRENTPPRETTLLAWPVGAILAPAYSGRTVYAGHWAETPDFRDRMENAAAFYRGRMTSEERWLFLRAHGITHVLIGDQERLLIEEGRQRYGTLPLEQEPFLAPVFRERGTAVYAVRW